MQQGRLHPDVRSAILQCAACAADIIQSHGLVSIVEASLMMCMWVAGTAKCTLGWNRSAVTAAASRQPRWCFQHGEPQTWGPQANSLQHPPHSSPALVTLCCLFVISFHPSFSSVGAVIKSSQASRVMLSTQLPKCKGVSQAPAEPLLALMS